MKRCQGCSQRADTFWCIYRRQYLCLSCWAIPVPLVMQYQRWMTCIGA